MSETLLPFHGENEAAALGCVFDCDNPEECFRELSLDMFYDERHRAIYSATQELCLNGGISLVGLHDHVKASGQLVRCGGISYLDKLPDRKISIAQWPAYIESLQEFAARRNAILDSQEIIRFASDPNNKWKSIKAASQSLLLSYAKKEDDSIRLHNASDFMAEKLPEPPQVVHGILHQGSKFCIGGASKACKTWALLDLALSVANGARWINFDTEKGRVLYLNFEIQEFAWQDRIKIVCKARQIEDLSNFELVNLRGKPSDYASLIPKLIEAIKDQLFSLVVIDPIYKLYGKTDENNARDVAGLLTSIEQLSSESGAAVAYASHFSKGNQAGKEAQDRVSGSGVFARDPDSLLVLTKHSEEDAFTVESILRNFAPVSPFVVRWQFPLLTPDESLDPEDLKKPGGRPNTYSETELRNLLSETSLTTTEFLKTATDELGVSKASFYRMLKSLEQQELILKSKNNQKWTLVSKVS